MGSRQVGRGVVRWMGLGVALWALIGCAAEKPGGEKKEPLGGLCLIDGVSSCRGDLDCGGDLGCSEGCCLPRCDGGGACADAPHCGTLGCFCDGGFCHTEVCASDLGCPTNQVCEAGACINPPATASVSFCRISPGHGTLRAGARLQLAVKAYDGEGAPLPLAATDTNDALPLEPVFRFESSAPDRVAVDGAGLLLGQAVAGDATITARIGEASCETTIQNLGPSPAGMLRIVAVDELAGTPIAAARVQIEGGPSLVTDAQGIALAPLDGLPPPPWTLSVFSEEHVWFTVIGTRAEDLRVPLRRLEAEGVAGGVEGRFGPPELFDPEAVQAGLAGMSIPGNLIDLSLPTLLGPPRKTTVTLGSERQVDLPSGVVLGLGNTWFKERYQALGVSGGCEHAPASSGCGLRTAWGIAGGMPLLDLPLDQLTEGTIDSGDLLAKLLFQFRNFRSAIVRDVVFELAPEVEGLPDSERLTPLDLLATQRMALRPSVPVPVLPAHGAGMLDGVVVLGLADVPERGLVPLGLTAGLDAEEGETPDGRVGTGDLELRLAPQHGGIEGSEYVILALAANLRDMVEERPCEAAAREGCAAISGLQWRHRPLASAGRLDVQKGGFLGLAEAASWDPADRSFSLGGVVAGHPDFYRLKLVGSAGRGWDVWFADTTTFRVPEAGAGDRAAGARASVQTVRMGRGLDALFDFGDEGLASLGRQMEAFSTIDLPR